jgi:hypothetical protein
LLKFIGPDTQYKRMRPGWNGNHDRVIGCCSHISLDGPDSIWVLASEGEAALLIGDVDSAVRFYCSALKKTLPHETGIIQSMYNQLCRLHWALGKDHRSVRD